MNKLVIVGLVLMSLYVPLAEARDYKINVIRPRYFVKKNRLELASDAHVVMNETFTYTFMFSAMAAFHLTEYLAIGVDSSLGINYKKSDAKLLKENFDINISTIYTKYNVNTSLIWSPVYGKYQLSSGKLIYFDTYFAGGGGLSGVNIVQPSKTKGADDKHILLSCMAASFGVGQRFYLNKHVSLKWQIRDLIVRLDQADQSCMPNKANKENRKLQRYFYHTIMFQAGASYFI